MTVLARRELLLAAPLAVVGVGLLAHRMQADWKEVEPSGARSAVPDKVGSYRRLDGMDIIAPLAAEMGKVYSDVEMAAYESAGLAPVMLMLAYDQNEARNSLKGHQPEGCYQGAGFRLEGRKILHLLLRGHPVPAVFLTATRGNRIEHILFWMRVADDFYTGSYGQVVALLKSFKATGPIDSALVRMSLLGERPESALEQLKDFAQALALENSVEGTKILFGQMQ
jgi:EpsI family protein